MGQVPRILIVDHDTSARRLLTEALAEKGRYEVVETARGPDGLKVFRKGPAFHLIVVDPTAHGPSGWQLLADVRTLDARIPILVLSTHHSHQSVARAMELGADDYLYKPFDLAELRRTVESLIHQAKQPAKARTNAGPNNVVVRCDRDGMLVELTALTGSSHVERFEVFVQRLLVPLLGAEECLKLRLALEETVANAVEWGNRGDRRKFLKLSYRLLPDRITFRIEDEGEGFNPKAIPDPTVDPIAHVKRRRQSGKRVGGWGLLLTRKAVDDVSYNQKGNVVFLTKFLQRSAPEPRGGAKRSMGGKNTAES